MFCTILRRSFMAPENAARGSSSSDFIWEAIFWCCRAICSTSPRKVSSDVFRDPVSWEPNDFRHRLRSFLEYSSSIADRAGERFD